MRGTLPTPMASKWNWWRRDRYRCLIHPRSELAAAVDQTVRLASYLRWRVLPRLLPPIGRAVQERPVGAEPFHPKVFDEIAAVDVAAVAQEHTDREHLVATPDLPTASRLRQDGLGYAATSAAGVGLPELRIGRPIKSSRWSRPASQTRRWRSPSEPTPSTGRSPSLGAIDWSNTGATRLRTASVS